MAKASTRKRSSRGRTVAANVQAKEAQEALCVALRNALSFNAQDAAGLATNWTPGTEDQWEDGLEQGRARFAELAVIARIDPEAARQAIEFAITSPAWGKRVREGWGTESGFARAMAEYVVSALVRQPWSIKAEVAT